ncbi:MAG: TetR/AcrR family transcriptional regulator [Myxococcales bacterium]|nr:TetR/AcrR family transcriptional regulator [Myxococcales bacterium]MBK7198340.1 TetR/AcrR family transcriptional regulator [Myxococcales bacterium]
MASRRAIPELAPRKRPTQARAQRTYRAIVEAGARVLERHGYEALTTNRVAELAGVGIASLYEYFPNKHALTAEVVRHVLDGLLAELGASTQLITGAPPEDAMRAWLGAMYAAVAKRRAVVRVIVQEVPFLWAIPAVDQARALLLALARSTRDLDARARRAPPLSDATVYLLATMTGAAVLEAVLRPPADHTPDELITALAEVILRATGQPPAPRRAPPRRGPRTTGARRA